VSGSWPDLRGHALGRRLLDGLGWGSSALAFLMLGGAMVWILFTVLEHGLASMSLKVVTHVTEGTGGGLLNAIEGTAVLAVGGILLAVPPGLSAGLYLASSQGGRLAPAIRFLAEVLVGVPSIVIGYFGYVTIVVGVGWKFSVAAGSVALAIIALPYICRTSEMAIRQVPDTLREAGFALGLREGSVVLHILAPVALPAILTGILLAFAIAVAETAPLLYTAGWSNYLWGGHLVREPIAYLTYAIWAFITEPFASAHALAYAAAFLVTVFVLLISVLSRMVLLRAPELPIGSWPRAREAGRASPRRRQEGPRPPLARLLRGGSAPSRQAHGARFHSESTRAPCSWASTEQVAVPSANRPPASGGSPSQQAARTLRTCPWAKRTTSPSARSASAITRRARAATSPAVSPPGTPPVHRVQPGTSVTMSALVRPS